MSASLAKVREIIKKSGVLTWVLFLILWKLISLNYSDIFLPGPLRMLRGSVEIIRDGTLFQFILISLGRVLKGWGLSLLIGIPVGVLIGRIPAVKYLVEPLVDMLRFVPAISLLTLFLMWFGVGERSKTALIVYASCFTIIVNTVAGVISTEKTRIDAARALGASEWQVITTTVLPSSIKDIFTGARLGLGNAFTAIVGAEMMAANEGLGYLIYTSRLYFHTDWILMGIITLCLIGYLADTLLKIIGTKCFGRFGVTGKSYFEDNVRKQ